MRASCKDIPLKQAILILSLVLLSGTAHARPMSDAEIRRSIIQDSLASYPGNCPCPYNTDRRGHACGGRSAYSRPGGYAPICYASQVTVEMIAQYRLQHRQ